MNKIKAVFLVVIFGLILLIFFQNDGFFLDKQSLRINLLFFKYQSPEVHNAVIFLAFFLFGLLISYFLGLPERYRLKRTVKHLAARLDSLKPPDVPPAPVPEKNPPEKNEADEPASPGHGD